MSTVETVSNIVSQYRDKKSLFYMCYSLRQHGTKHLLMDIDTYFVARDVDVELIRGHVWALHEFEDESVYADVPYIAQQDADLSTIQWIEDNPTQLHPGSQQAIENHFWEDITDLFNNIHSTKSEAMQYILGFQVGCIK